MLICELCFSPAVDIPSTVFGSSWTALNSSSGGYYGCGFYNGAFCSGQCQATSSSCSASSSSTTTIIIIAAAAGGFVLVMVVGVVVWCKVCKRTNKITPVERIVKAAQHHQPTDSHVVNIGKSNDGSDVISASEDAKFEFDVFLSHDWGTDENNRDNHARVAKVNELLKARGFRTWFDNDRMVGDIVGQMCQGVERSAVFIAFITARYMSKVASNGDDNCKAEFSHAVRRLGTARIVPVVMEQRVKSTSSWVGPVGMRLGDILYVSMAENDVSKAIDQLSSEIIARHPACKSRIKTK